MTNAAQVKTVQYVDPAEMVDIPNSRGQANLVIKCRSCERKGTVSYVEDKKNKSVKVYLFDLMVGCCTLVVHQILDGWRASCSFFEFICCMQRHAVSNTWIVHVLEVYTAENSGSWVTMGAFECRSFEVVGWTIEGCPWTAKGAETSTVCSMLLPEHVMH
jgi:hypothetical protein